MSRFARAPTECGFIEGWGRPRRAGKAHYFVEGVSLCGVWDDFHGPYFTGHSLDTDCQTCNRMWRRMGSPTMTTHQHAETVH